MPNTFRRQILFASLADSSSVTLVNSIYVKPGHKGAFLSTTPSLSLSQRYWGSIPSLQSLSIPSPQHSSSLFVI